MSTLWLKIHVQLRHHHKLISVARTLDMPEAHVLGHLACLWLGALEYAEDGDLWRGDEEASMRFVRILSGWPVEADPFVAALRSNRWLDGWLIHDWLDYTGKYLSDKYKSRRRRLLVEIWAKHGRVYGRDVSAGGNGDAGKELPEETIGNHPAPNRNQSAPWREAGGNRSGRNASVQDKDKEQPLDKHSQEIKTLNPSTRETKKRKTPNNPSGGSGDEATDAAGRERPKSPDPPNRESFFSFSKEGLRVEGLETAKNEASCAGFTLKEVFDAFRPILAFHGIVTMNQFHARVKHCRTSPADWLMLYLDKVHAVYRDRGGTTWLEGGDADPVAMTVAALNPKAGAKRHAPSNAARELFMEIMLDLSLARAGAMPRWQGKTSGPTLALELSRRKGGKGKLRNIHNEGGAT